MPTTTDNRQTYDASADSAPVPASSAPRAVRVGVVAQDPVTLAGVTGQLRGCDGIEIAPCSGDRLPDVVVVASDGRTGEGLRAVGAVRAFRSAGPHVVAVMGGLDNSSLLALVEAGAAVVLARREATDARLCEAVRMAVAGGGSLPSEWLRRLMTESGTAGRQLTARELKVLRLLADGYSTAEIAAELAYSESTIKMSIHELTTRLKLRNRSHAVAFALRAGLI